MKQLFQNLLVIAICLYSQSMFAEVSKWNGTSSDTSWYNEAATDFHLYTAAQLKGLADIVNDGTSDFRGKTIYLENDIDLSNYPWTPIGYAYYNQKTFCGSFNGLGHTISNIKISTSTLSGTYYATGFFGLTENAEFKNINIQGEISHDARNHSIGESLGGLVGSAPNGKIENVKCKINISFVSDGTWSLGGNNTNVGFIAGKATTISRVQSEGMLSFTNCGAASGNFGGIAGRASDVTESCSKVQMTIPHSANIGNPMSVGGIAGYIDSSVKNTIFSGGISVNNQGGTTCYTGGICGMGTSGIVIENVIAVPSFFYSHAQAFYTCLINRSAAPVVTNAYYANTYAGSYETYGTSVSEDYLKSGIQLSGFDTNIWDFAEGRLPRLKSLIPNYSIYTPTEHGSIAYCVKEGGEARIEITSNREWEIDKVYVNQIDVTSQMEGNMLFLQEIQENKELFVVYKQSPSNVGAIQSHESFNIARTSDGLSVSGALQGKSIAIYDLNGKELARQVSNGNNHFALPKGFYIITTNGQSKKVSF